MKENASHIRILIAEDHELVRHGLRSILGQQNDLEIIGEASSCANVLTLSSTLKPDVILLDLTLEDGESLKCITPIKDKCPRCKILIFTAETDTAVHLLSLRYGAVGVLLKKHSADLICKAIRQVHLNDELWIDQTLITELWKNNIRDQKQLEETITSSTPLPPAETAEGSTPNNPLPETLTPRESQIACLSSKGLTAKQIGEKLFISEKTVRNQLTTIFSKLNVKNQLELSIKSDLINVCD